MHVHALIEVKPHELHKDTCYLYSHPHPRNFRVCATVFWDTLVCGNIKGGAAAPFGGVSPFVVVAPQSLCSWGR